MATRLHRCKHYVSSKRSLRSSPDARAVQQKKILFKVFIKVAFYGLKSSCDLLAR